MESTNEMINTTRDFHYNGNDHNNFVRCCSCRCYTHFVFYIVSVAALKKMNLNPIHNFFCVECLPKSSSVESGALYPSGSILDNEEIMELFEGYTYYNPYYHKFASKNILIITELTKIRPNYKAIVRKPLPADVKLEKIYNLFPPVHQLPNKKYVTVSAMYGELRRKYQEIRQAYDSMNPANNCCDSYMIVEPTPQQPQTARKRTRRILSNASSYASDVYQMRSVVSDSGSQTSSEGTAVQISSESISDHSQIPDSEQLVATNPSIISDQGVPDISRVIEINISSQEISDRSLTGLERSPANLSLNSSISSTASTVLENQGRRPLQGVSYSQEAGPSGLQHQPKETPQAKRRRITPVNPTPEEVQSGRKTDYRLPRLSGG